MHRELAVKPSISWRTLSWFLSSLHVIPAVCSSHAALYLAMLPGDLPASRTGVLMLRMYTSI